MNITWTKAALLDLTGIYEYIARSSPQYAISVVDRITARSVQLGKFPRSGHVVPEYERPEIREVIVYSYRLIYTISTDDDILSILSIVHGASQLPMTPPTEK